MTAAHYKGGHQPGNDLGLHYTALPPIVASCPYSNQLLVTRKFWSPGANRPSQVRGGAGDFCRVVRPRAALDTLPPAPSTALFSAQEAKERLREIVEGFFFRQLRADDRKRVGRLLVKSPPGLGK